MRCCNVYNNENVKLLKTKGVIQIEQSKTKHELL